jgi:hypothetical protein
MRGVEVHAGSGPAPVRGPGLPRRGGHHRRPRQHHRLRPPRQRLPIDVPSGIQTQGDILIEKTRIDGASYSCIGVAQDSKLAGATIRDCPAAQSPYLILRYPVDGVETYPTQELVDANPGSVLIEQWLTGVWIEGLASEYLGDGAVVDGVGDEGRLSGLGSRASSG